MSKTCTFFGHRDTPKEIKPILRGVLTELIEKDGVDNFFIGNQGGFDVMVREELKELSEIYPHIKYTIVLAYLPTKRYEFDYFDYSVTEYPEGLENVPKKFAIDKRNRIMIDRSDIVVTYIRYNLGGAAKFKEIAEKKGKKVINIAEQ